MLRFLAIHPRIIISLHRLFLQLILILFLDSVLYGSLDGLRTLKEGSKKVFRWAWMMNLIDGRSTPMDVMSEFLIHPFTSIHEITHSLLILHRMLFNPIVQWWRRGPINCQIHKFLWSQAPLHYKISMLACMCLFCHLQLNLGLRNQCVLAYFRHLIGYRHVLVL